ncbi:hypothetical protein FACS1894219_12970 [Clostridia bacterium]|nr:hypothetical protein FACS1894219_12970 [Clostridia bacterium]
MTFPNKETVEQIRKMYPVGTKIAIVSMSDPYVNMPAGTNGFVTGVDSTGTIFAKWSNGSSLGAVYGEDIIRKMTITEVIKTQAKAVAGTGKTNMFDKNEVQRIAFQLEYYELVDFIVANILSRYFDFTNRVDNFIPFGVDYCVF